MFARVVRSKAVVAVLLLSACLPRTAPPRTPGGPEDAAQAYLDAWAAGDLAAQRRALAEAPADFDAQHVRFQRALGLTASRFERRGTERDGEDRARVSFVATHALAGLGTWEVKGWLELERRDGAWRVRWTPAVLHPEARPGDRFARVRTWPARAALLDADGAPLTAPGEVIRIGVNPQRMGDRAALLEALRAQLGLDPARVEAQLAVPPRDPAFVPLVDVRPERYQQVRAALAPVPGIFFRRASARLSPAEGFAAHTLGRVGEATAEALEALGAPYQAGDVVGLSGLERALERTLAGAPSGEVRLERAAGEVQVLHRFVGEDGAPVRTTLRRDVQRAAEAALADVTQPAALVAVDAGSGEIVAVASRPLGESLHRALAGRYPPGSTFKVVTAEALLARGATADLPVTCPAEVSAGGKRFRNFEAEALGPTTLRRAFAWSCNTTFILLGAQLDADALGAAARRFGFGVRYEVGLPSPGATFPAPRDAAERAAAAIGQGRVLATPLHMATVAAAAGTGVWRAPRLLRDADAGPHERLSRGAEGPLRDLLRAVVTEGSARAAAGLPDLLGKTGTAEFGQAQPPQTHAWFIGLHRGLAFAVLVEAGGVGGRVAVPLAARFVQALEAGRP